MESRSREHSRRRLPPSRSHTAFAFEARTGVRRTRTARFKVLVDIRIEDAVTIVDDEAVWMIARQGFPELLQRPFRRGMGRDVVVDNLAGSDLHDNEDVEGTEWGGDHHEEIAGHHDLGVVVDEGQPALFRVR